MPLCRQFVVVPVLLAVFSGCGDPTAPDATEPATAQVTHRLRVPGETLPTIRVESHSGTVEVTVERPAFCATVVYPHIARSRGALAVVSQVSGNPAAGCPEGFVETQVVKYVVTVGNVRAGTWNVRVFEVRGTLGSRFLTTKRVRVRR